MVFMRFFLIFSNSVPSKEPGFFALHSVHQNASLGGTDSESRRFQFSCGTYPRLSQSTEHCTLHTAHHTFVLHVSHLSLHTAHSQKLPELVVVGKCTLNYVIIDGFPFSKMIRNIQVLNEYYASRNQVILFYTVRVT